MINEIRATIESYERGTTFFTDSLTPVILIKGRQQERFTTATDASNNFHLSVPSLAKQFFYVVFSIDNHH